MKQIIILLCFLFPILTQAQNINGKAYYQSKTTVKTDDFGSKMDENMKKMIMERMKKMLEKTYILTFTKNESIYKEEESLEAGKGSGMMGMMMGSLYLRSSILLII